MLLTFFLIERFLHAGLESTSVGMLQGDQKEDKFYRPFSRH